MYRRCTYNNNLQQFECLREKMINAATVNGLKHPQVLQYSRELDHLHNELLKNVPRSKVVPPSSRISEQRCDMIKKSLQLRKDYPYRRS